MPEISLIVYLDCGNSLVTAVKIRQTYWSRDVIRMYFVPWLGGFIIYLLPTAECFGIN
ncbi:uncharacterized protein EV154DRAFT_554771 [Mucor mucedo]|uniref:uncharacterized protein n=1 Tax=Mucor mucedo TaxID=29922 RepID=UPI00221F2566|nr:uncharacterized protein EV154DRAFT_554771 [Mucor mucedo]KAI7885446.1 hypothetical protein EV154DRAFT_554771 [Mucor mucedo]